MSEMAARISDVDLRYVKRIIQVCKLKDFTFFKRNAWGRGLPNKVILFPI